MVQKAADPRLDQFYEDMERDGLQGFWRVMGNLRSTTPMSPAVPHRWPWAKIRGHLDTAADLVTLDRGAERRTMLLVNPGLKARYLTTPTLAASVQIIRPGEFAPAHRHSGTAIRFVIEGAGAFTNVEGESLFMEENDLILTPALTWHYHGNESEQPIVWMDGLDAPLMMYLALNFSEEYPEETLPNRLEAGATYKKYGAPGLRPSSDRTRPGVSPLLHYRWRDVQPALLRLAEVEHDPHDGAMMDYVNPLTGRHALRSMACRVQLLREGMTLQEHRHTGHFVYHVVQGTGATIIDGERFDWTDGDFFVVPPWKWHRHEVARGQDAILFSLSDLPLVEALGMYREEARSEEQIVIPVEVQARASVGQAELAPA